MRSEDWNLVHQSFSANSSGTIQFVVRQQGGSVGGGEILVKKVLTPSFGEPFALQKVRTTSFMKILQGKVYCKVVESTNST